MLAASAPHQIASGTAASGVAVQPRHGDTTVGPPPPAAQGLLGPTGPMDVFDGAGGGGDDGDA